MNTTALRLRPLAIAAILAGAVTLHSQAQTTAYTDPVGYYTLKVKGGADNVLSLPMMRDAVFAGTVQTPSQFSFTALAGASSPAWAVDVWKYAQGTQRLTYYVEFTSGALKGLFYKISANAANSLSIDTEGDDLLARPLNGANVALATGDSFKIRPFWTIADLFEVGGTPILKQKVDGFDNTNDEVLIPDYVNPGINKAASLKIFYLQGNGWRAATGGNDSFADQILRPNEAVVVRRRGATDVDLTNLGGVLMNKSIYYVSDGGTSGNDTYFSLSRPTEVSLNDSGLRSANAAESLVMDTPNKVLAGTYDTVLAFDTPATGGGFNRSASHSYYYLAGQGWREIGNSSTTIGADVKLKPGQAYIIRKRAGSGNRDWTNNANY